jgi:very-short-patch-repair endonuclease
VGGYKVDVGFPNQKVTIETDGCGLHRGHSPRKRGAHPLAGDSQEDFQNDRERQNKIALLGWQVLRFTWLDLTEYPQRVLAEIRIGTGHAVR